MFINKGSCLPNIDALLGVTFLGVYSSVKSLMTTIEENIAAKENDENIPETGKTVLRQQYALIKALDDWIKELKNF